MSDDDARYIVVDGRRWRATDPGIPEKLRQELVNALMAARRAVRSDDGARAHVQDAKVALGERGEPWWEETTADGRAGRLAATMRALLRQRKETSSICPSDAARVVGGTSWRTLMDEAREAAGALLDAGIVRVTQKDDEVDPRTAHGPIRIRRGTRWAG